MRIGITGHRDLTPDTIRLASRGIEEQLCGQDNLVGVSSLAEGADQIFARLVLERAGILDAIVPSMEYRSRRDDPVAYDLLLQRALRVTRLPFVEDGPAAHMAASLGRLASTGPIADGSKRPSRSITTASANTWVARASSRQATLALPDVARPSNTEIRPCGKPPIPLIRSMALIPDGQGRMLAGRRWPRTRA